MSAGDRSEASCPGSREAKANDAMVATVRLSTDETGELGAVDELDNAVVAQEHMVGDVPDSGVTAVSADREQQLILGRRDPGVDRLLFAPVQELA